MAKRVDNRESVLFNLPTELLLELEHYLGPCAEVSLRQSCSRFFYLFSYPSFYLKGDARFVFLCNIERDDPGSLGKRKRLVCGHCRDLHSKSAFPSSQLTNAPQQRDCRQIWLCPHRSLGFEKAVRSISTVDTLLRLERHDPCSRCKPVIRNRSVAERNGSGSTSLPTELDPSEGSVAGETMLISKIGILQKPAPLIDGRVSGSSLDAEIFTTKELARVLSALNFCICPHLQLGDPYILSKFCRACLDIQPAREGGKRRVCISLTNKGEKKGMCKGMCYAKDCKTGFMFQSRQSMLPGASGRRQVWLILSIFRWLGSLTPSRVSRDPTAARPETGDKSLRSGAEERLWTDHTVDAAEMAAMRGRGKAWMGEFGSRCLPDWSICELHPEDFSLR